MSMTACVGRVIVYHHCREGGRRVSTTTCMRLEDCKFGDTTTSTTTTTPFFKVESVYAYTFVYLLVSGGVWVLAKTQLRVLLWHFTLHGKPREGGCRYRGGGGVARGHGFLFCLPLAAPIGLSPLHIPTLCGSEGVLVASTRGGRGPQAGQEALCTYTSWHAYAAMFSNSMIQSVLLAVCTVSDRSITCVAVFCRPRPLVCNATTGEGQLLPTMTLLKGWHPIDHRSVGGPTRGGGGGGGGDGEYKFWNGKTWCCENLA